MKVDLFDWSCTKKYLVNSSLNIPPSPPNFFFQLQGILQRWVLMVCLQSVPVRVPSLVPSPQSPSLATHTLHCHSPQSDLRSFFPVQPNTHFNTWQTAAITVSTRSAITATLVHCFCPFILKERQSFLHQCVLLSASEQPDLSTSLSINNFLHFKTTLRTQNF
uniref:Uncharacterized protein n=1 Tax=Seriola dumerili TaxID=41447 RepID=A0A3B4V5X1_SERDU